MARAKRVYVDESGVNTHLQREYARAPRGEPVADGKRGKKFDRANVIGALCGGKHFALECYRQTTDSAFFERRFEKRRFGHTIIMDNARFHSKKRLRKLARGKAWLLFLPPYSPDYNPIEKTWANMKRFLGNNLQSFQSVDSAISDYFNVPVN